MSTENTQWPGIGKHMTDALETFPETMTKKDLVLHCARYIAVNPEIYITPEWLAKLMMDDSFLLSKRKKMIPGSRAYVWVNEHKRFQQNPYRLRL
jgi:homoserine kinase